MLKSGISPRLKLASRFAVATKHVRHIESSRTRATVNSVSPSTTNSEVETTTATTDDKVLGLVPKGSPPLFVKTMSSQELGSFILLSAMTSTKFLVNLSSKMLPYVPSYFVKKFVFPIYCGGETFSEVRQTGKKLLNRGIGNMMLSYAVEDAEGTGENKELLDGVLTETCRSIDQILVPHYDEAMKLYESGAVTTRPSQGFIALKPTGLSRNATDVLRNYDNPEFETKWNEYLDVCRQICQYAVDHAQGKVAIVFDAEKKALQDGVYAAQRQMMKEFNKPGKQVVVVGTIQMYLQDSLNQLNHEMQLARDGGYQLGLKLVRGAYMHSEPNRMKTVHLTKEDTDSSFDNGTALAMDDIIAGWKTPDHTPVVGKLVLATHNDLSADIVDKRLRNESLPIGLDESARDAVVFGQLMGMADNQSHELAQRGRPVIKYVPWGPAKETKEYLVRRLEENGDAARDGGWPYAKYGLGEAFKRIFKLH